MQSSPQMLLEDFAIEVNHHNVYEANARAQRLLRPYRPFHNLKCKRNETDS
jgi:hypothetical protein